MKKELKDALNRMDEIIMDTYSDDKETANQQQKDYDLLFDFIDQNTDDND